MPGRSGPLGDILTRDPGMLKVCATVEKVAGTSATEDEAITNDVVASLASDPRLDDGLIGVETFRNEVTLTGRVGALRHVDIAESRAAEVPGVREVHNHLRPGGMRVLTR